jgi:DNA-binding MarR family transcriptional regulator
MTVTERQQQVIDVIVLWWTEKGYGPSLQDIADELGITRPTVYEHYRRLVEAGRVYRTPGVARSITVKESDDGV